MAVINTIKNGSNVVAWFSLETDRERNAFIDLANENEQVCQFCGTKIDPKTANKIIIVDNPIQGMLGMMDVGTPAMQCPKCKEYSSLKEAFGGGNIIKTVSLEAFPSIMRIIQTSRMKYRAMHQQGRRV